MRSPVLSSAGAIQSRKSQRHLSSHHARPVGFHWLQQTATLTSCDMRTRPSAGKTKPMGYDIIAMHLAAINCFESCCFAWASVAVAAVAAAAETRTRRHGQLKTPSMAIGDVPHSCLQRSSLSRVPHTQPHKPVSVPAEPVVPCVWTIGALLLQQRWQ
jgi:hypothetical protein